MMKVRYRSWSNNDAPQIRHILHDTWYDAYASFIPEEDISEYLDQQYSIDAIKKSIADPKIVGIIADVDGVPAGCIRIYYNIEEQRMYVQQLYVLPKHQRIGLGRRLMEFAAERAQLLDLDRVWLGVMVKNEPAVIWYTKMGYEIAETAPFMMGKTNADHYIGFVPVDRILSGKDEKQFRSIPNPLLSKIKMIFDSDCPEGILPKQCFDLLEQQKRVWPQLSEGYSALDSIKTREIVCSNYSVELQFNPKRIASTMANTDPRSIGERKCFLCVENLPEPQKGILYHDEYLILCNPAPIYPQHYTFVHVEHTPQVLKGSFDILIGLARDLSPDFTVFYNGPRCGASAPDHMHFQMIPRRAIPVESDAVDMHRRKKFYYKDHVAGFELINYGRAALVIESTDRRLLINFMKKICAEWKKILNSSDEPRMNVLCSYQQDLWRVIIFPRSKHRPDLYFKEGEGRVVVSPAAVDIGGFIITPFEKDFLRIDAKLVEDIFSEVTEKPEIIAQIIEALK
jgi:ribosomal protein S18 acetylase RimI-like enzyme